jgi:hypothetical protein
MGVDLPAHEWRNPTVYEIGKTVADARRIVREADDVWVHVEGGRSLKISKNALLKSMRWMAADDPIPLCFYVAGTSGLEGSAWIGWHG